YHGMEILAQAGFVEAIELVGRTGHGLEGDGAAVPGIDEHDREGEIGNLLLGKLAANPVKKFVGNATFGQLRDSFGPGTGGAFARIEEVRVPPVGDVIEPQLALAVDLGFLDMHVEAEGAAIDLRCPDVHEIADLLLDDALPHGRAEV